MTRANRQTPSQNKRQSHFRSSMAFILYSPFGQFQAMSFRFQSSSCIRHRCGKIIRSGGQPDSCGGHRGRPRSACSSPCRSDLAHCLRRNCSPDQMIVAIAALLLESLVPRAVSALSMVVTHREGCRDCFCERDATPSRWSCCPCASAGRWSRMCEGP